MNSRKNIIYLISLSFLTTCLFTQKIYAGNTKDEVIVVSMGDSYSSGEGVEPFYDQDLPLGEKIYSQDWLSHRSQNSWGSKLGVNVQKMVRNQNWFFVAMSGAIVNSIDESISTKTYDAKHPNPRIKTYNYASFNNSGVVIDEQIEIIDEINEKYGKNSIDYVTLTIGGNDLGFEAVIGSAALFSYFDINRLPNQLNDSWKDFRGEDGRISVRDNLYKVYKLISDKAGEQANIIVAGYPTLISENGTKLITKKAATTINGEVKKFNNELNKIVAQCKEEGKNVSFVSVEKAFFGKEAGTSDEYINNIILKKQNQDLRTGIGDKFISAYSMHPNEKGTDAYAKCVNEAIQKIEKTKYKETDLNTFLKNTLTAFDKKSYGEDGESYEYDEDSLHLVSSPMNTVLKLYKGIENSNVDMVAETLNPTSEVILKTVGSITADLLGNDFDLKEILNEYANVEELEIVNCETVYQDAGESTFLNDLYSFLPSTKTLFQTEANVCTKVRFYYNGEVVESEDHFHLRNYGFNNWRIELDFSD